MTPEETARATAEGVSTIGSHFMLHGGTYARGGELGFAGLDFYVTGRGGVLGPVDADVVTAAFAWFEPAMVRANWQPERASEAALEFAQCAYRWADDKLAGADVDLARLGELAGRVAEGASPAGAPVFAAWRRLPLPESATALAIHHMNALRELRGGLHAGAALAAGLRPVEALLVKTPHMAPLFGWTEPYADVSGLAGQWQQAEEGTNRAIAPAFAVLDESERAELAELVAAAHAATSGS
jgi:hypothetical protein